MCCWIFNTPFPLFIAFLLIIPQYVRHAAVHRGKSPKTLSCHSSVNKTKKKKINTEHDNWTICGVWIVASDVKRIRKMMQTPRTSEWKIAVYNRTLIDITFPPCHRNSIGEAQTILQEFFQLNFTILCILFKWQALFGYWKKNSTIYGKARQRIEKKKNQRLLFWRTRQAYKKKYNFFIITTRINEHPYIW